MHGGSKHKVSSHLECGQRFEAVKHAALKTGEEIFHEICFKNKNYLPIKNYSFF